VASISEGDFAFIGNSCQIQCTRFQAAFISPRVHSLLQEEPTLDSLFLECQPQPMDEKRVFDFIERLLQGLTIEPLDFEISAFLGVASFLGNRELAAKLLGDDPVNQSNVCSRLRRNSVVGISVEEEIEFAAARFHELDPEQLKGVDLCILEAIVSSDSLRLHDEDSLLNFICSVDSASQIVLLRYLRSEYLSCAGMTILLDLVYDFCNDPLIWTLISHRLRLPVSGGNCDRSAAVEVRLEMGDGIMAYLTQKCGGNVHTKGLVTITSKSLGSWAMLDSLVDLNSLHNCFVSKNEAHQWVCWDFHEMRVRPTRYTISAPSLGSWVVEGSADAENWTEIHRYTGYHDLRNAIARSFEVVGLVDCRFIRFTQTGRRRDGTDVLALTAVEFFGALTLSE
jgi:hypothetical protein